MAGGGVHEAPYEGARALLDWAVDIWPYVNGKFISTNGRRLAEMDAADMLDVLHYYFEEDLTFDSNEAAENKTRLRKMLYDTLYDKDYIWGVSASQRFDFETDEGLVYDPTDEPVPAPVNPSQQSGMGRSGAENPASRTKRYVPPTEFNADAALPFGKVLDPPMH